MRRSPPCCARLDAMASDLPKPAIKPSRRWLRCLARELSHHPGARNLEHSSGLRRKHQPQLGPGIRERMAFARTVSEQATPPRHGSQTRARDTFRIGRARHVLALPTAPCIAPRFDTGAEALEILSRPRHAAHLHCRIGGLPQVTLPVGSVAGCPVGLSFIAWHGGDETLLDLAVRVARTTSAACPALAKNKAYG